MPYTMVVERQIQPVEARFHSSGFVVRSPIDDTGKAGMNDGAMAMISAWADGSDRVMG